MNLVRTTVRLEQPLKQAAQKKALELNVSLQELLQRALKAYLEEQARTKAKKLVLHAQNLGAPLDQLSREDIYAD